MAARCASIVDQSPREIGAGVVERPRGVVELERLQAERLRQPDAERAGRFRLRGDGGPRAVELLRPTRARERLERVHAETPGVRRERSEWGRTAHVRDPW